MKKYLLSAVVFVFFSNVYCMEDARDLSDPDFVPFCLAKEPDCLEQYSEAEEKVDSYRVASIRKELQEKMNNILHARVIFLGKCAACRENYSDLMHHDSITFLENELQDLRRLVDGHLYVFFKALENVGYKQILLAMLNEKDATDKIYFRKIEHLLPGNFVIDLKELLKPFIHRVMQGQCLLV